MQRRLFAVAFAVVVVVALIGLVLVRTAVAQQPGGAACPDCSKLAADIDRLRRVLNLGEDNIDLARQRLVSLAIKRAQMGMEVDELTKKGVPLSAEAHKKLQRDLDELDNEKYRYERNIRNIQQQLENYKKELAEKEKALAACNARCHKPNGIQQPDDWLKFLKKPVVFIPAGVGATLPFVLGGDGNDPTVNPPAVTPGSLSPPTSTTPPGSAPPSQPPAQPAPPTQPADFTVIVTATGWDHVRPGEFSDACGRFTTDPPQAGAAFTVTITGPGVSQGTVTGTTSASGVGLFRARITLPGPYSFTVSVTVNGVTRTTTGTTNVTTAAGTCASS